jgi:GNAT superfamily N-acetyltransferase
MVDAYDLDLDVAGRPAGRRARRARKRRRAATAPGSAASVTPFGRRRGIGERLMRAVIDQARERGGRRAARGHRAMPRRSRSRKIGWARALVDV